jgi:hypothetical protein
MNQCKEGINKCRAGSCDPVENGELQFRLNFPDVTFAIVHALLDLVLI